MIAVTADFDCTADFDESLLTSPVAAMYISSDVIASRMVAVHGDVVAIQLPISPSRKITPQLLNVSSGLHIPSQPHMVTPIRKYIHRQIVHKTKYGH